MVHSHIGPRRDREFAEFDIRILCRDNGNWHQRHGPAPIEVDMHDVCTVNDRPAADALAGMSGAPRRSIGATIVAARILCLLLAASATIRHVAAVVALGVARPANERARQECNDHQAGNSATHNLNYSRR